MQHLTDRQITAAGPGKYQFVTGLGILVIALGCMAGILVPAGLGWDFANFYDAGRIVAADQLDTLLKADKGLIAGTPAQGNLDFWGTPLSAYLYVPMSRFSPAVALILFKIENVLAYTLALLALFFHLRRFVSSDSLNQWHFAALFVVFALLFQPFWTVFRVGGQTTASVFLLLCLALIAHGNMRHALSSFLFVAAVMIKPALSTGLLFLMLLSGWRFALFVMIYFGILGIVSVATMGWDIQMEFIAKMLGGAGSTARWYYNSSVYTLVSEWQRSAANPDSALFPAMLTALKLGVVATMVLICVRTRQLLVSAQAKSHFYFMLSIVFFLLISQTLWEHYLAFLFIPLAFLIASRRKLIPATRWMIAAIVICMPLQNLILVQLLQSWLPLDSLTVLFPVVILKTAPLWITWILLLMDDRSIANSYPPEGLYNNSRGNVT